jgi:DNA polymerase III alpha subunit (gram-positive type)
MKIVAFNLRTGGPRTYEHGVLDVAAVVLQDGELVAEYDALLKPHALLSYRPISMREAGITMSRLDDGLGYDLGMEELCEFLERHAGHATSWAFDAREKAAYVGKSLQINRSAYRLDRVADALDLAAILYAVGASSNPIRAESAVCRMAGLSAPEPHTSALEGVKTHATAVAILLERLESFYRGTPITTAVEVYE